jgi:NAD(P)-dependent dehydrogenase (short-subunit alcohol dehydrogenase family)
VAEGAFVIVSDIDEPGGRATADGLGAAWLKLDVRAELARIGAMARVLDSHGRLDMLVNNASIRGLEDAARSSTRHDPEHAALADWHAVMRTNLDGVLLGCKHALRAMHRGTPAGSIINIASRSGRVGVPAAAACAASEAAVVNHTRSVALYCAEQGLPEMSSHERLWPLAMRQNSEPIRGRGTVWNPATHRWAQRGGIVTESNGTVRVP